MRNECLDEIERLQAENASLAAAFVHIGEYWNGAQTMEAMYDACKHIQEFASSESGGRAVLRDLLGPTIELLSQCHEIIQRHVPEGYGPEIENHIARLRSIVEGKP